MSKGNGGTRTVSSANAAASRTLAQSAIGGSVSKIKESMAKDFEDSLNDFLLEEKEEIGAAAFYGNKDSVDLDKVQGALSVALHDVLGDVTDMTTPTHKNLVLGKSVTNNFSFRYKGNKIEISKLNDNDSSVFHYSINGGEKNILAKNKWGGFAHSGNFNEGMKSLLDKMKKM